MNKEKATSPEKKAENKAKVISIIGIVLCAILCISLILNVVIIIKGAINEKRPPSIFGLTPMVVGDDSMSGDEKGHLEEGDFIIAAKKKPEKLKVGDVISFVEDENYRVGKPAIAIHQRIYDIREEGGERVFITKADTEKEENRFKTSDEEVIGKVFFRLPALGSFMLFLQKPIGMIICVGLPILAFIIYDIIRRKLAQKQEQEKENAIKAKQDEMLAEIERLRALANQAEPIPEAPVDVPVEAPEAPAEDNVEEASEVSEAPAEETAE